MIRRLADLDLRGKRVFVRVDFNVPLRDGSVAETHRIDSAVPTLRALIPVARKVIVASHLGRPGGQRDPRWSLAPVRDYLERALQHPVVLAPDCVGPEVERLALEADNALLLLENLRFHPQEEANDSAFAAALARLADAYVNDAFGAAHRAHASVAAIARCFTLKGAGLLLERELHYLGRILERPERPFCAVIGGAKISDKIGILRNLLPKLDALLIGGAMAYTFLLARGVSVGKSLVERDRVSMAGDLLREAAERGVRCLLPVDHIAARAPEGTDPVTAEGEIPPDLMGLDVGPRTVSRFSEEISRAKLVLWNGPLGRFEDERFFGGTRALAQAVARSGSVSVIAGGDTVAAVVAAGVEKQMTHLSTGGGATLEFLEGKRLPGIEALES